MPSIKEWFPPPADKLFFNVDGDAIGNPGPAVEVYHGLLNKRIDIVSDSKIAVDWIEKANVGSIIDAHSI
ncbi:hypothetical protein QYF36_000100 [Acer negundo]|nr:hypothetical protein QYF36_000100 [Acer negundo]